MNILSLELKQVDKFLKPEDLNIITAENAIGKNTEKAWILNCNMSITEPNINNFLSMCRINGYFAVIIQKEKSPN